jgi:predicted O-methyltransferase YrrM
MKESRLFRFLSTLGRIMKHPRKSVALVRRGMLIKDRIFEAQTHWVTGKLPRVPLVEILPSSRNIDVCLPNAFNRQLGTSISVEEACHLGAIARALQAKKILEIGTYDGNSALVLATNSDSNSIVITVDLPPDFDPVKHRISLAFSKEPINLTERDKLGTQLFQHQASSRVRQVYGDSGSLDWSKLGGPFNLIFIDGCHTERYVESDTQNALKQLAPGGIIVWHDYGMIADVSTVVDRFAREMKSMRYTAIEGTRLAIGIANP